MSKKRKMPDNQLPMLCPHCGGPARDLRNSERVLFRCTVCGKRLYAYYVDPARSHETPPEREDEFFIKRAERDLANSLSQPAQALYEYLRRHARKHGYAPSFREMRDALGWESHSTVSYYMKQLIDVGLVEQDYATARAIRLPFAA